MFGRRERDCPQVLPTRMFSPGGLPGLPWTVLNFIIWGVMENASCDRLRQYNRKVKEGGKVD